MKPLSLPVVHKLMFPLALLAGLASIPLPAGAEIYKWVDGNDQIQYTQTPPPTGVATVRIQSDGVPNHADGAGRSSLQDRLKASEERQQEAEKAAAQAEKKAEIQRIIKENCAAARNNLEQLNRTGQVRYRDSEGRVLRLDEEDRIRRIEESKMQIEEFCKG